MADQIPDSANALMWLNADTCIENAEIAYDDSTEDEGGPVDTVISSGDLGVLIDLARYAVSTRAAPPAMDREAVERVREAAYRQALEDVCNPLGYLQRMADAEGAKLSGMAYAIASDIGTIQRIAKEALSTLSADAIRQGEGERGFCNKCGFVGVPQKGGFHYRPKDGQPCNYICPVSATPASHASNGGE